MKNKPAIDNETPLAGYSSVATVVGHLVIALESIIENNEAYFSSCKTQDKQSFIDIEATIKGKEALAVFYNLMKQNG